MSSNNFDQAYKQLENAMNRLKCVPIAELKTYTESSPMVDFPLGDKILDNLDQAYEQLSLFENLEEYEGKCIAFKYYKKCTHYSKVYDTIKSRLSAVIKRRNAYADECLKRLKQLRYMKTCSNCGSKIATVYLESCSCPICHCDLRTKEEQRRSEKYRERVEKIHTELLKRKKYERGKSRVTVFCLIANNCNY